jgi:hypothetical protein
MASRRLQVSVTRAELCVEPNPSRHGKRKHTKVCGNTVRHLDSGSTINGAADFTWLQASEATANLVAFDSTSTGEYQVLCRVDGVTLERRDSIQKPRAASFRRDPVGTECDTFPCQPGFVDSKYHSCCLIIVKCFDDSISNPGRFRFDIVAENALLCPVQFHRESVSEGAPMPIRSWWNLGQKLPAQKGTEKRGNAGVASQLSNRSLSLSSPGRQCRNQSQFVASLLSGGMTLLRNLRFAIPSEFRPNSAPFGHARLDSGRGSYCLENIANALQSEDEAEQPWMAPLIQGPATHVLRWWRRNPPFDFVAARKNGASHRKKGGHVTPKLGTAERQRGLWCLRRLTFAASTNFVSAG